jgi:hypothetical protein
MSNAHSTIRLRRVSPLGAGLICAAVTLIFAIVFGGIFLLIAAAGMGGANAPSFEQSGAAGITGALIGVLIIYPVMGFIGGVIYAAMFNLIAPMIGGLELKVTGLSRETEEIWNDA